MDDENKIFKSCVKPHEWGDYCAGCYSLRPDEAIGGCRCLGCKNKPDKEKYCVYFSRRFLK